MTHLRVSKYQMPFACISGVKLLVSFIKFASTPKAAPNLSREDYDAVVAVGGVEVCGRESK